MSSCVNNNNRAGPLSDSVGRPPVGGPQPSVQLKNGELTVNGTKGADNIQVVKNGSNVEVRSGDQLLGAFPADQVKSLNVKGGKGNDQIKVDVGMDIKVRVDGGKGNDKIEVQNARDAFISGGKGNDEIVGRNLEGGVIKGGKGTDSISLYDSKNLDVDGGKGHDDIRLDRVRDSRIKGGRGNDKIELRRSHNNDVEGNRGADDIKVHGNDNRVRAGKGDDRVELVRGRGNHIDLGRGHDTFVDPRANQIHDPDGRVRPHHAPHNHFRNQVVVTTAWLGIGLAVGIR